MKSVRTRTEGPPDVSVTVTLPIEHETTAEGEEWRSGGQSGESEGGNDAFQTAGCCQCHISPCWAALIHPPSSSDGIK